MYISVSGESGQVIYETKKTKNRRRFVDVGVDA